MEKSPGYAVITGDFTGFSRLDRHVRQSMPGLMAEAGDAFRRILPGAMPYPVSVFRGDSWQVLLTDPACALRAAVFIRAYIRAFGRDGSLDTRMAIGIGDVDYVPEENVSAGDGPAFRCSGKMLEKMTSPRSGTLRYAFADAVFEQLIDALVFSTGALMEAWRPLQARAVAGCMEGLKQKQIAESWPVSVTCQAVSRHLKKARWQAIDHAIVVFEKAHNCMDS